MVLPASAPSGSSPSIQGTPDDMRELIRKLFIECVGSANDLDRFRILKRTDEEGNVVGIEERFMKRDGFYVKFSNFYDLTRMTYETKELEQAASGGGKERTDDGLLLDEIEVWRERVSGNMINPETIADGLRLFRRYGLSLKVKGVLKVL